MTHTFSDKLYKAPVCTARLKERMNSTWLNSLFISCLFLCLAVPFSVLRPFHSKGEPREALVAQSMLSTGNWILPRRYQNHIATKPPMTHWMMSSLSIIEGRLDEVSARMPSLLMSLMTIIALFVFVQKRISTSHARLTALALMTSALWLRSSVTARVDMPLAAFMTCSLLMMYIWEEGAFSNKAAYLSSIAFLVMGTLTKGPVALVLPAIVWFLYLSIQGHSIKKILTTGLLLFGPTFILSSVWYILAYLQGGDDFLTTVLSENLSRMTGHMNKGDDPHQHSIFFLLGSLFAGLLPWSLLLFFMPWSRRIFLSDLTLRKIKTSLLRLPSIYLYSLIICAVTLLFFSVPSSKKAEYLLPLYPFLMILFVGGILHFYKNVSRHFLTKYVKVAYATLTTITIVFLAMLVAPYTYYSLLPLSEKVFYRVSLPHILKGLAWMIPFLLAFSGFLSYRAYQVFWQKRTLSPYFVFGCYLMVIECAGVFIIPPATDLLSAKHFAQEVHALIPPGEKIYSNEYLYGMDFYLDGQIQSLPTPQTMKSPSYVLLSKKRYQELKDTIPSKFNISVLATAQNDIRKPGGLLQLVKIY